MLSKKPPFFDCSFFFFFFLMRDILHDLKLPLVMTCKSHRAIGKTSGKTSGMAVVELIDERGTTKIT